MLPCSGDVDGQRRAAVHYRHRSSGKEVLGEVNDNLRSNRKNIRTGETKCEGRGKDTFTENNGPVMNTFFFHLHRRGPPRNQEDDMQSQSLLTLPILSLWELRTFTVMEGEEEMLRETQRTEAAPPLCSRAVPRPK